MPIPTRQVSIDSLNTPPPLHKQSFADILDDTMQKKYFGMQFSELLSLYNDKVQSGDTTGITKVIQHELTRRIISVIDQHVSDLTLLVNEPFNDEAIKLYEPKRLYLMKLKSDYMKGEIDINTLAGRFRPG